MTVWSFSFPKEDESAMAEAAEYHGGKSEFIRFLTREYFTVHGGRGRHPIPKELRVALAEAVATHDRKEADAANARALASQASLDRERASAAAQVEDDESRLKALALRLIHASTGQVREWAVREGIDPSVLLAAVEAAQKDDWKREQELIRRARAQGERATQ